MDANNKTIGNSITLILIENKIDLENERKIIKERGEQFANKNNIDVFESSGKSGVNAEEYFIFLGEQIVRLNNKNENKSSGGNEYIISKDTTYKNTKKCC